MKQLKRTDDYNRQIPTVIANTVRGAHSQHMINFSGKEIIGYINIGPETTAGIIGVLKINPMALAAPRLRNMASNYQQYQFKRLKVSVRGNLPTIVGGDLYTGYSRNPDFEIADNSEAPANIFALENSTITNLWTVTSFECPLKTTQWFNVDEDSDEIMLTTQGKIFIGTLGQFNVTANFEIPVFVDYELVLRGQQSTGGTGGIPIIFPATVYSGDSDANGNIRMDISSGETLNYPWNRGMRAKVPYVCDPQPVLAIDAISTAATPEIIVWDGNTTGYFSFYNTLQDYYSNEHLIFRDAVQTIVARFTIELQPYSTFAQSVSYRSADGKVQFRGLNNTQGISRFTTASRTQHEKPLQSTRLTELQELIDEEKELIRMANVQRINPNLQKRNM